MIKTDIDTIEVELTQACVLRCAHCFLNKISGPMTKDTFKHTLEFIKETSEVSTSEKFGVIFTGGEPSLFDLDLLLEGIHWLKANITKPLKIYFQTSLIYDITEKHMQIFKEVSEVSTSWDYKMRFDTPKKEAKLFSNIAKLKAEGIIPHLIITITDQLVAEVTPEMFMSFVMSTGLRGFDFNRLFTPGGFTNEQYSKITKAKAAEMSEWLFKAYKIWDKVKDDLGLFVFDFQGITDSYHGIHYNQWSKTCPANLIHITSTGKIAHCHDITKMCFGDVNKKEFDEAKYNDILKAHREYRESEDCKTCKYFQYCQCGCPWMYHDETGCTTPKKVYEYLRLKDEMKEEQR